MYRKVDNDKTFSGIFPTIPSFTIFFSFRMCLSSYHLSIPFLNNFSITISLLASISFSLTHSLSLYYPPSLSHSDSLSLSLSLSLSTSISHSLPFFLSLCSYLSLTYMLSQSQFLSFSHTFPTTISYTTLNCYHIPGQLQITQKSATKYGA